MDDASLNLSMFRAYDIRTPSAKLPPDLAARLARAEARYYREVLGVSAVVVAHDARSTGPRYLGIATAEYQAAGLDVLYLPGVSSTSLLYYAAMRNPDRAAVMIGASHNPAGDTGRKILAPGVVPIAEGIGPEGGLDQIKKFFIEDASPPASRHGSIRAVELIDDYIAYSMDLAGVQEGTLAGLKLGQDYLNGAAGREMMLAFDRAGAELIPLHFAPDGSFPLGDPNPVKREVIQPGRDALQGTGCALSMIFDGDGDRLDIYGGDGAYLASSFVYAAILPTILRRLDNPPDLGVFADLKANPLAVIEMARAGVAVDVIRNGHSQIKESLLRDPSRLGAVEESAHFYEAFSLGEGRYCTENTLYMALLVARVWHDHPERFQELFALQATTARQREWGYKFASNDARAAALDATRSHFLGRGAQALERMKNGMDLEATLLRVGLPFDVDQHTRLSPDWFQVSQRISQSEDGLARWEVVGARADLVAEAKRDIAACVARFGAGKEYQG